MLCFHDYMISMFYNRSTAYYKNLTFLKTSTRTFFTTNKQVLSLLCAHSIKTSKKNYFVISEFHHRFFYDFIFNCRLIFHAIVTVTKSFRLTYRCFTKSITVSFNDLFFFTVFKYFTIDDIIKIFVTESMNKLNSEISKNKRTRASLYVRCQSLNFLVIGFFIYSLSNLIFNFMLFHHRFQANFSQNNFCFGMKTLYKNDLST